MASTDEMIRHMMRLVHVVRSAQLKQSLTSVENEPALNFWRIIYGNLLDVAVLEWCKVFGSHSEPTHWKNVVTDHNKFRNGLLQSLNIDRTRWESYWDEMKKYRDTWIAHHTEPQASTHYPNLELALESSYYYYAFLIGELRDQGEIGFPDDLRNYGDNFARHAINISREALAATAGIAEEVE
jgi:hypothetical protein